MIEGSSQSLDFKRNRLLDDQLPPAIDIESNSSDPGTLEALQGKLLVIDDQVGVTKAINLVASDLGLDVKVLTNPARAIDVFIGFRPDIVILDIVMPEKDGIDVLNELLMTGIRTQMVLMTGFGAAFLRLAEGVAKFHGAGRVASLRKPFRRDELVATLQQAAQAVRAK